MRAATTQRKKLRIANLYKQTKFELDSVTDCIKMSSEWEKYSVAELIKVYKEHENLYNSKQKLYYNKQARNSALEKILKAVQVRTLKE
jgi:Alcohol dehydrogenase transcription factor Myb/SANT-like